MYSLLQHRCLLQYFLSFPCSLRRIAVDFLESRRRCFTSKLRLVPGRLDEEWNRCVGGGAELSQGIGSSGPDDGVLVAEPLHQTGHPYILVHLVWPELLGSLSPRAQIRVPQSSH